MHFNIGSTSTRTYSKRGKQPIVHSCASSRQKLGYVGFVTPRTGELFVYECDVFNAETFTQALHEYERTCPCDRKRVIILDNASWHKKATRIAIEIGTFVGKHHYLYLPPYSPDLNPIERVWRITRRYCTHNRYFPSIAHLRKALTNYFDAFSKPNITLYALCS